MGARLSLREPLPVSHVSPARHTKEVHVMTNPLSHVREGMKVLDRNGDHIGSVDWVKMTDEDPNTVAVEQLTSDEPERRETLVDFLAEAFRTDDVPEQLREKLMRSGFLRVDADGLFASDRYVLPDQIAVVTDKGVILDVEKDALIKRH
jgi:hypothetical protein